jgi:hypothetical protein
MDFVWAFSSGVCASAIFSGKEKAEAWIKKYALSGILEKMPLDKSVYDWTIEQGYFKPKRDDQKSASFIGAFTSAYLEHYHYENGQEV